MVEETINHDYNKKRGDNLLKGIPEQSLAFRSPAYMASTLKLHNFSLITCTSDNTEALCSLLCNVCLRQCKSQFIYQSGKEPQEKFADAEDWAMKEKQWLLEDKEEVEIQEEAEAGTSWES